MDKIKDLETLLRHDVQMLYSVEEQIVEALPAMIAKAENPALKQALEQHLKVTETQRERIDKVRQMMGASEESVTNFSGILSTVMGGAKCKGIEGIIEEGEKMMAENMAPEVMDAAIIGGSQKIEHFEIAAYGTARTFAQQLGLTEVAQLLQTTLDEEYRADETLTSLAVSSVNMTAEGSGSAYNTSSSATLA